jgi:predicted ester cyclase
MLEQNKALVRRYYEEATGDLSGMGDLLTDSFIDHHFPPNLPPGLAGVKTFFTEVLGSGFSQMQIEHDEMIAEGNKVVCKFALRAIHSGEFAGIAATGKEILCPAISIFRIENGKLAEAWEVADVFGLLQQLQSS